MKVDGGKSLDLINYPYIFMVMHDQTFDLLVINIISELVT